MKLGRLQQRLADPKFMTNHAKKTRRRLAMHKEHQAWENNPAALKEYNPSVPIPGLPVPPASSLGSPELMESHYKATSPEFKTAANFNPSNNTVMICGRPVQLVLLSHEESGWLEKDTYVSWLFRPLVATVLDGYTAGKKHSPTGPKHYCVIRWFQVTDLFISKVRRIRLRRRQRMLPEGRLDRESLSPPYAAFLDSIFFRSAEAEPQ